MVFGGAQFYSGSLSKQTPSQIPALQSTLDWVRMATSQLKVYSKMEMGDGGEAQEMLSRIKLVSGQNRLDFSDTWSASILEPSRHTQKGVKR